MSVRLRKILGDLRASKSRTALVALSITLGVTAVGTVTGARAMMLRSLKASHEQGAFPSATLTADAIPPGALSQIRRLPGVDIAELRHAVGARAAGKTLTIFAVPDWRRVRLARVAPEDGAWPPPPGALVVERRSLGPLGGELGGSVEVGLPAGVARRVRIAGTVHDLNVPSTRTSGILYGYATTATLRTLGVRRPPNEVLLRTGGDRDGIERVVMSVRELLSREGVAVRTTDVPKPGTFWANDAVDSMVLLLTVLAVVCLLMSVALVANIVAALVAGQIRQIGVMKAVGARAPQATLLYLATAAVYGGVAIVVGVPLAAVAGLALVSYSTGIINLDAGFSLPGHVLALELGAGLLLPLVAAVGPAVGGGRITVRDAIARHGVEGRGVGLAERFAARASRLPTALRLGFTNALRGKRRLALTLAALALGGAIFIAVLSVRSSLLATLDAAATYRAYDLDVTLERAAPPAVVASAVAATNGAARAEGWTVVPAHRLRPGGNEGQTLSVIGVPAGSAFLRPSIVEGRWLRRDDRRAIVLNTDVLEDEPGLDAGDPVQLVVGGRRGTWRVVGIARRVVVGPAAYASQQELGTRDVRRLAVVTDDQVPAAQVAARLAERLGRAGYPVFAARTSGDQRALDRKNFGIIVSFLLSMAILLAVVGGLGLLGTLSINVLERSREIGVLRAVGAGDGSVMQLVLVEALVVAVLGWLIAVPLSIPIARALSAAIGRLFLGAPLEFRYSAVGALVWLALILVLAAVAAFVPALRAVRLSVRQVLSYE